MPKIAIIMGSDSDLPVMQEAAKILEFFEISFEISIVSAHRTPEKMFDFAKKAHENNIRVIIAGAGGSAHLPGMVASLTHLPVIGVPIKSQNLSGLDSLYSIVQMPPGVPVGTMAINGSKNAGLYAVQILACMDDQLAEKLIAYKTRLKDEVIEKSNKLEKIGFEDYLTKTDF